MSEAAAWPGGARRSALTRVDPADPITRVERICAGLRAHILSAQLSAGERLPSVRTLARSRGVSPFTAARAYELLLAEGLIEARRGAGYFVARGADAAGTRARPPPEPLVDSVWALRRDYDRNALQVDAGCGWLPPEWLFGEGVRAALTQIARRPAVYAGRYGNAYGLLALRHHLARQLALRGIDCADEQVVLTQGASQALELVIAEHTRAGDMVLVDDPGYPNLLAMLRARGVRPVGVPRTDSGPDAAALDAIAAATGARLFVTNTTHQNPTGTSTTPQTAHAVLGVAERRGLTICEDEIFAELPADPETSLASLDRLERVIYVGSFSKTIAPSLRVGYLAARGDRAERMATLKSKLSLSSSELTEHIVLAILTSGRHRTHLERLRRRLSDSRMRLARNLREAGFRISAQSGGMFAWAELPDTESAVIMQRAKAAGILLAPGSLFHADERPSRFWRFNVAYADDERLYQFLRNLRS